MNPVTLKDKMGPGIRLGIKDQLTDLLTIQLTNQGTNGRTQLTTFASFLCILFTAGIVPEGFLPWEIRVAFLRESQLRQGRATNLWCMLGVLVFP